MRPIVATSGMVSTCREWCGKALAKFAIAVDCSGSVNSRQLSLFEAEVRSILEGQRPQRVYVLYFDAVVHKVETFEAGERVSLNPVGVEARSSGLASSGSTSTVSIPKLSSF